MDGYRAYFIDREGHIFNRVDLMADNDELAKAHAKQLSDNYSVELWDHGRKVAVIAPSRPSAGL